MAKVQSGIDMEYSVFFFFLIEHDIVSISTICRFQFLRCRFMVLSYPYVVSDMKSFSYGLFLCYRHLVDVVPWMFSFVSITCCFLSSDCFILILWCRIVVFWILSSHLKVTPFSSCCRFPNFIFVLLKAPSFYQILILSEQLQNKAKIKNIQFVF